MGRITATVLFTDLVSSTELRARIGEEAAEALRRRHDLLLTQAVQANNGRVIKGLGDGIMATFTGASDAVATAVAIQQAIERLNRSGKASVPLAVRVGLSAGDVTVEDDDVHGTPVIQAARLCAAAQGGEVLASELVSGLVGANREVSFLTVGALDLKGLAEPVSTVRVHWEPLVACSIPMPVLLTDVGRIFVGRDAEVERLDQLWKEAAAGERRVMFLAGEPGAGKTRLAAEVAIRVHEQGGVVLAGRCDEDLGVPYQPFVEALRHFADHTAPVDLAEHLGRYGGELTRLVPELVDTVPGLAAPLRSDPETERYRLFDAVAAWLAAARLENPLLLVLDDLQWAAKPTLLLLRHVVCSPPGGGLLIVGTYRDTELTYDHPLVEVLTALRRREGVERLPLSGLDSSGVAAFMEQAAGRTLGENDLALARAIHDETEGNPFFVREVLRHLTETGLIERRAGSWGASLPVAELGIPEGVRDVIGRRLARLSQGTNRVLQLASVVGADFEVSVVGQAGDIGEDDVLAAVEEAATARLVSELPAGGRYRFGHALVRDTLYDALSATRRMTSHRRVAEAIEVVHAGALDDQLPALAHHWGRASAATASIPKAVDYATRAGQRAMAQLAHHEAVVYYGQALELLTVAEEPEGGRRLDLLISLGEAEGRAGVPGSRRTLFDAARLARQLGDAAGLARAALANSRGVMFSAAGWVDEEIVAVLEAALDAVGPADSGVRARLLARLGLELHWSPEARQRRVALSDQALDIARRLGDTATLAAVLAPRFVTIWAPDNASERLANLDELDEVIARLDDPVLISQARSLRFRLMMEVADVAEADRALAEFAALADDLGQPTIRWLVEWPRAARMALAGRLGEAEQVAAETMELGFATGQGDAGVIHVFHLLPARLHQGRMVEFEPQFVDTMARHGVNDQIPLVLATRALIDAELNRRDRARQALESMAASGFDACPVDLTWFVAMAIWADVAGTLGHTQSADMLRHVLRPYGDRLAFLSALSMGTIASRLGLLATTIEDYEGAESDFARAEEIEQRIGAPCWLARTRMEWARMLLRRSTPGDADRARGLLAQAIATARKLDLAGVERHAVALLQDCP